MKPARVRALLLAALVPLILGWVWQWASRTLGAPLLTAPWTVTAALLVLAVVLLSLAIPIRRRVKAGKGRPIDPFHATRVLALARAAQLTGAVIAGFLAGSVVFFLALPQAGLRLSASSICGAVAAILLLIAGLVAERFCKLPPEDTDTATPTSP